MNEDGNHRIIVGGKACGKSETMRRESGLSHEEFEENIEKIKQALEKEKERREIMKKIMELATNGEDHRDY